MRPTTPDAANPSPPDLRAFTSALARGDDPAWSRFHREYGPTLFRQLLASTRGDHALASDALQQTYLRVARSLRPCDAEPQFHAWLRIVARSALADCRRRQLSFWQLLLRRFNDPSASADHAPPDDTLFTALDFSLAAVDPAERQLLEAKYFAHTSVRQIAAQLGLTEKAAESRLTRAREKLRIAVLAQLNRHE